MDSLWSWDCWEWDLWEFFWPLRAIAWSGSLSGEIRKTMRKVTRRFRGFMPSVPGDCSAEDWEKAYRSWDSCRRPRMIRYFPLSAKGLDSVAPGSFFFCFLC